VLFANTFYDFTLLKSVVKKVRLQIKIKAFTKCVIRKAFKANYCAAYMTLHIFYSVRILQTILELFTT